MKSLLKYIFICLLIIQTLSCNMDNKTPDKPTPEEQRPSFEGIANEIYSGSINYGETVEIESFTHSVDNYDTGEFHSGNSHKSNLAIENCYIYEFTATSNYISVQTLESGSPELEPGFKISSATIKLFDKSGDKLRYCREDKDGVSLFSTVIGEKYYIGIIPMETIYNRISYKSDIMKFIIKEYEDKNNSVDTAENISINIPHIDFFTGKNDIDYFKVNLTQGKSYFIDLRAPASPNAPSFTLTSPLGEVVEIINYHLHGKGMTATVTGEYLFKITQSEYTPYSAYQYWLSLRFLDPSETIEPSSNWIDASVKSYRNNYYMVNIDITKDYSISWKDRDNDNISYSGDVNMSLLYGTNTGYGNSILSNETYRGTDPRIIDFESYTSHAILFFKNWGPFYSGTFSFKIEEVTTHPTCIAVPLGVHTITDINNGVNQFYKFTIDQSKKYILKTMDRSTDNTKYEGEGTISIYTPGKIEYLKRNSRSGFDHNISFSDTTAPNTELILKVHLTPGTISHDGKPIGTIGFELVEDTSNP